MLDAVQRLSAARVLGSQQGADDVSAIESAAPMILFGPLGATVVLCIVMEEGLQERTHQAYPRGLSEAIWLGIRRMWRKTNSVMHESLSFPTPCSC